MGDRDEPSYEQSLHINAVVRRLAAAHRARTAGLLAREGIAIGQELLLLQLADHGECTQRDLAEAAGLEAPTITAAIQKLEAAGLVSRTRSASDGRAQLVSLTAQGLDVIARLREIQRVVAADVERAMHPDTPTTQWISAADRAIERLGAAAAPPPPG